MQLRHLLDWQLPFKTVLVHKAIARLALIIMANKNAPITTIRGRLGEEASSFANSKLLG